MNIKEIAELASTSVATVSRVINRDAHVAPKTRQRVLDVIAATGYKPHLMEKSGRPDRRKTALVLLPDISNPYFSSVLLGINLRAAAAGFETLQCVTNRDYETEKRYLGMVEKGLVAGLILFTSVLGNDELNKLAMRHPIVQCDTGAENIAHISFTCIDNAAAADEAVSYLLELGHDRIALINGSHKRPYETLRQEGYLRALRRAGRTVDDSLIAAVDYKYEDARSMCAKLLAAPNPPTAFFCISDMIAAGALRSIVDRGLAPGKDVDVIGFDGTYLSDIVIPSITSIEQPGFEIGKNALDLLIELINEPDMMRKKVIMPHKLVIKQSTRPRKQALS